MDVIFINHRDPYHPNAGGAENVIYEIGRRLRGVTWLSEEVKGRPKVECLDGIKIIRKGNKFTLHYYSLKEAKKHEIVIDSIAHAVPFFSYLVNKKAIALVHHVHQDVVKLELNPILAEFIRLAERRVKNYKYIISVSNTTKQDLIKKLKVDERRITVIYNGVDHDKFKPGEKSEKPIVFWIGRMMKYKNPFDVIEVKRRVEKGVKFVVAGGGELSADFAEIAKKEGIEYLGKINEKTKIELYKKSWVILSTSFIEGWGMTIVEANSCGTPAVVYSSGSLPEIVKQGINGFVVPYKDINSMAKYINYITSDENIMKELSRKSYEESLKYDWNRTAEEYKKYLERVKAY